MNYTIQWFLLFFDALFTKMYVFFVFLAECMYGFLMFFLCLFLVHFHCSAPIALFLLKPTKSNHGSHFYRELMKSDSIYSIIFAVDLWIVRNICQFQNATRLNFVKHRKFTEFSTYISTGKKYTINKFPCEFRFNRYTETLIRFDTILSLERDVLSSVKTLEQPRNHQNFTLFRWFRVLLTICRVF